MSLHQHFCRGATQILNRVHRYYALIQHRSPYPYVNNSIFFSMNYSLYISWQFYIHNAYSHISKDFEFNHIPTSILYIMIGWLCFMVYQPSQVIECQSLLYIYMICKWSLSVTFLNKPELICLHTVKWFQV